MSQRISTPLNRFLLAILALCAVFTTASGQITEVPNPDETVGIIRMSDMEANAVLDMLERFTGKPILRQQNLPAVKINFSSRGAMTKGDAVLALESLLSINGIAITDLGEKFLKAVPAATASTQVPPMLDNTTRGYTPSQKIYAKFFQFDYLTVEEALPLIQPLLTQGTPITFIKSNSLLVVDALINLQRLEDILDIIDKPTDMNLKMLFFQLKHINASEIATRLQAMQTGSLRRFLENNTTFDADDRTNQLIVFTHKSNEELLTDLIEKLDIDVAPSTQTEVYRLKHADATEVTNLIEQVISGQQQAQDERNGNTRTQRVQQQQQANTQQPRATNLLSDSENLQFSEYIRIVADPRGNAIVAYGTPSDLRYLNELIEKVDILLAQVRIEVVIAEVTLTKDQMRGIDSFGIDFDLSSIKDVKFDVNSPSTSRLGQGYSINGDLGAENMLSVVIDAARRQSNVQVLSTPTIVTTHNQEATIIVGEQRPVITATQSDSSIGASIRSNVQFRDIAIELKVKPLIGSNGVVQMEIDQKVESVVSTVEIDGNEQPIIGRRQATSFISVADGELVVLGGLQQIDDTDGKSRLTLLGSLPVVGGLFGSRTHESVRRELLMFIQPHVITSTADANSDALNKIDALSEKEQINSYLETGTFKTSDEMKRQKKSVQ